MTREETEYLKKLAKGIGVPSLLRSLKRKKSQQNPLDNSMWENMLDGALKSLETVALLTLDWKLTTIVKLLQSWLKDKREEKAQQQQKTEYGYGDTYNTENPYYY